MDKKLLAIAGSPHKDGATGRMLRYATETAQKRGWQVDYIDLYEQNIAYCKGCNICRKTHSCVQQDDIQKIAKKLLECDLVILAAPVYWANVPAVVKNMFDRLVGVVMEETTGVPKPRLSGRQKYILLTACNTAAPFCFLFGQSTGALGRMKEFFRTAGMKYAGKCVWAGRDKKMIPLHIKRKIERYF